MSPKTYRRREPAFNTEALYVALDKRRRESRTSGREVMRQAGISTPSMWTRLGRGHSLSADNLVRLLVWLGDTDVAPYVLPANPPRSYGETGGKK